jgi:hypothetical protein
MADTEEPGSPDVTQGDDQPVVFESLLALEFPPPEFEKLQDEYYRLWSQMVIDPAKLTNVDNHVDRMAQHQLGTIRSLLSRRFLGIRSRSFIAWKPA